MHNSVTEKIQATTLGETLSVSPNVVDHPEHVPCRGFEPGRKKAFLTFFLFFFLISFSSQEEGKIKTG